VKSCKRIGKNIARHKKFIGKNIAVVPELAGALVSLLKVGERTRE
jgi:hypothetical protein